MKSRKWEMPKVPAMASRFSFKGRLPSKDDVEEIKNEYTGV